MAEAIQFPEKLQFLFKPMRYKVTYGGRGASKSWGYARALLSIGATRPLRVLCVRELQQSIAESVHKLLSDQIRAMGLEGIYEIQRDRIIGPQLSGWSYRTEFNFEGIKHNSDKVRSYEGIDVAWVEEAHKVSQESWEVLTPTIRKDGSEIWVSFNTGLEKDYTYDWFVKHPPTNSVVEKMSWRDNPWFNDILRQEMEDLKARDYDSYLNVWEGEPKQILEGAVYANELRSVVAEGRICRVPWERSVPVDTYWDLGRGDHTAIWFAQYVGFEYRVLDYYQNRLFHLDHYLGILQSKGYIYGTIWIPHDGAAKTLGTKRSVEEQIRDKGYRVRVVPRLSKRDGITAARTIFPNCWFDQKKTEEGVQCLRSYRFAIDPQTGTYSQEPIHDSASDGADGFRYMAIALKEPKKESRGLLGAAKKTLDLMGRGQVAQGWMK